MILSLYKIFYLPLASWLPSAFSGVPYFVKLRMSKHLRIWVVDFDGQAPYSNTTPFVGPFVTQTIQNIMKGGGIVPGYTFAPSSQFDNDPLKVRESVYDFHAWAAVIVNPNATALLDTAVRQGNASYDPLGACQIIYNSARDQTTASSYIVPSMTALQKQIVTTFGRSWINHLRENNVSPADMHMDVSPQAISPGIECTCRNLFNLARDTDVIFFLSSHNI